jgi:hypothetical protein
MGYELDGGDEQSFCEYQCNGAYCGSVTRASEVSEGGQASPSVAPTVAPEDPTAAPFPMPTTAIPVPAPTACKFGNDKWSSLVSTSTGSISMPADAWANVWGESALSSLSATWEVDQEWKMSFRVTSTCSDDLLFGMAGGGGFFKMTVPANADDYYMEMVDTIMYKETWGFEVRETVTESCEVSFSDVTIKTCPGEPSSAPTPTTCVDALRLGPSSSGGEYQLDIYPTDAPTGMYTITAWAMVTDDYDGTEQILHSRFYSSSGEIGTTGGGWPTQTDTWEQISVTFDSSSAVPTMISWYVGYPEKNSNGYIYVTNLQIIDPDGKTLLEDGDFPGGADMSTLNSGGSYGTYSTVTGQCGLTDSTPAVYD